MRKVLVYVSFVVFSQTAFAAQMKLICTGKLRDWYGIMPEQPVTMVVYYDQLAPDASPTKITFRSPGMHSFDLEGKVVRRSKLYNLGPSVAGYSYQFTLYTKGQEDSGPFYTSSDTRIFYFLNEQAHGKIDIRSHALSYKNGAIHNSSMNFHNNRELNCVRQIGNRIR